MTAYISFNLSYYTATYLVGARRFGVPFPKLQTFSKIFRALYIDYTQYKARYQDFLFIYFRSYNDKSKFSFLETVQSSCNTSYLRTSHLVVKMLVQFFSSNIPLYIGENPVKKLCKVLEMELETYVHPSRSKICF